MVRARSLSLNKFFIPVALLLLCSSCISLPDDARDVFTETESSANNSYKKGDK